MAQRAIHYLFGTILAEHIELKDKKRFLMGHVMPDAIDKNDRSKSHFETIIGDWEYYDFNKFQEDYHDLILHDDLYLGYYMHLVEDNFYREVFYRYRNGKPIFLEQVPTLHNDYNLLNNYIVEKYKIENLLGTEFEENGEDVFRIGSFRVNEFLKEMSFDFIEKHEGTTVLVTEEMVDEFVENYIPLAIKEVQSIVEGKTTLKASDYAWRKR